MDRENALRKLVALRKIRVDLGASPHEAENAHRISERLMSKHEISPDDVVRFNLTRGGSATVDWTSWQLAVQDFGLTMDRFGSRGQIRLPDDTMVFVSLNRGDLGNWRALRQNRRIASGGSPHSLRQFLSGHAPKGYSLRPYPANLT